MVRICDGRMSGTAYGTVVLHVAPEAAAGGPLALVQTGDWIELDVANRRLTLDVPADELAARSPSAEAAAAYAKPTRGWERLYIDHVLQADSRRRPRLPRRLERLDGHARIALTRRGVTCPRLACWPIPSIAAAADPPSRASWGVLRGLSSRPSRARRRRRICVQHRRGDRRRAHGSPPARARSAASAASPRAET